MRFCWFSLFTDWPSSAINFWRSRRLCKCEKKNVCSGKKWFVRAITFFTVDAAGDVFAFVVVVCDAFGFEEVIRGEDFCGLFWTTAGAVRFIIDGDILGFCNACLIPELTRVDDISWLWLINLFGCCCWDACKKSKCFTLSNASKTSVCGQAPVIKIRTKLSLFDLAVGLQTSNKQDEYQWWWGITECETCWLRIGIYKFNE